MRGDEAISGFSVDAEIAAPRPVMMDGARNDRGC